MEDENATMIALNTAAVLDEIADRLADPKKHDDDDKRDWGRISRRHINEALSLVQPSDDFYALYDDLRSRVIDAAAELAAQEEKQQRGPRWVEDMPNA